MRIRAALLRGRDEPFSVEDVELDEPGPGEVLVRIAGAGFCHTDVMPRHGSGPPGPVVLGHEGAGVVEAVGPGVAAVSVGDHVVLTVDSCGSCALCQHGEPAYCEQSRERNFAGFRADGSTPMTDGAGAPVAARWFGQSSFATHAIATERNTVVVDPALPLAMLGPLGCSMQTGAGSILIELDVRAGSSVVVFGTGAVGMAAVMAAAAAGAREVVAVELHPERRELALELGATRALDGRDPDVAAQVVAWTGGGADVAFDTTGVSAVVATALSALRPKGRCGLVAPGEITLPPRTLTAGKTLTYLLEGGAVPQRFIPRMIGLWQAGRFPFDRLVRTYPLAAINDAERDAAAGTAVKPVLVPS